MNDVLFALVAIVLLPANFILGQQPTAAEIDFFESKIRPALVKYCYECHSVEANDSRGGLLVDTKQALFDGGDSGPAVVPHDLDESLLWEAINWDGYEMPPSKMMPESVIGDFKKWIEMGAPDPRVRKVVEFSTKITKADIKKAQGEHWAFQKPQRGSIATIDGLVNTKLNEAGLTPTDPADPFTLLRRINFDLVGLPPTPAEIKSFYREYEQDSEKAIQKKVDELLAREQFGERWGRHWMDVARFAETSGSRNVSYPHAWRYRDYVIDSFNDDTPYNRFVAEQIAGDLLPVDTDEQWQENLIATGFLAIGLKHHDQKNPRIFEADMVDEQIDTMTQAFLGLTVACARCHDHKYDPIPTDDYYAMAGILKSTKTLFGTNRVAQNHRTSSLLLLPVEDKAMTASGGASSVADLKKRIANLDEQIANTRRGPSSDGGPNKDFKHLRNVRNRLAGELATFNSNGSKKTFGMGVQEADQIVNANILISSEVDQPAQEVTRGFLQVMGDLNFQSTSHKSSGRLQLAKSMASDENPLTARVMANRIWMHLLGRPLVETPNNFGLSGMSPDNPELLDYLAIRFVEQGWSVKTLIREIMLSDTYQRSSKFIETNYTADPDNKNLWRVNPRALDAEALRDSMLAFAGQLDLDRPYGSAVGDAGAGKPGAISLDVNAKYRSVYLPVVRDGLIDAMELFNFPDPNMTSASRQASIVPTQALYMMNSEFVTLQANTMASTLERRFADTGDQVRNAFLWVYGRPATEAELKISAQFFKDFQPTRGSSSSNNGANEQQRERTGRRGQTEQRGNRRGGRGASNANTDPVVRTNNQALAAFCQTLMASARFRILN